MTTDWDWVELGDSDGRLDRPSTTAVWSAPPEVELDGEWLVFRYPVRTLRDSRRELERRRVRAGTVLLTEFVKLDEAPPEQILAYARQHGPLGFCRHGDPSHRIRPGGCAPRTATGRAAQPALREALRWWRNLAGHARTLLNVAAQLSKGRVEDTMLVRLNPELLFSAQRLAVARDDPAPLVTYGAELWLTFFQVRPRPTYNPELKRLEVRIRGIPALPGALAWQIMLALTRSNGIAFCSGCGKLFSPSRRPNPNRNTYCRECGRRAAWRDAQTRMREKKANKRRGRV